MELFQYIIVFFVVFFIVYYVTNAFLIALNHKTLFLKKMPKKLRRNRLNRVLVFAIGISLILPFEITAISIAIVSGITNSLQYILFEFEYLENGGDI